MTLIICECPRPAEPPVINRALCIENIGQLQRIVLQRAGHIFDSEASPTPNPITAQASWTPLLTAVDSTKAVITPYFRNPIIGKGEVLKEGGNDNTTLDGVEDILGLGFAPFTAMFKDLETAIIEQIQAWMCEVNADPTAVVWYGFNNRGQIIAKDLNKGTVDAGKQYTGMPLQSLFCTEPGADGFATRDTADFGFSLPSGWTRGRAIVTPAFNVKALLSPTA